MADDKNIDSGIEAKPSAAQKRQVKFSGLVKTGIIAPLADHETQQFTNSLQPSPDYQTTESDRRREQLPEAIHSAHWELVDGMVIEILVELVDDSPYQLGNESSERYNPEEIDELAHTMAAAGQREPIQVRRVGHRFQLIAGHRRLRAAKILGWVNLKAIIVKMSDDEANLATMVHNEGRKGNSDYYKAKMYQRAQQQGFAKTQNDIAALFATTQSNVSRCQKMLKLPAPIIELLEQKSNLFSSTAAEAISQLVDDHPTELDLIKQAVERLKGGAPENSIKGWVSQMLTSQTKGSRPKNTRPKVITDNSGRQLYTARLTGRMIELRLSSPELDGEVTLEKLIQFFKNDTEVDLTNE